MEERSKMGIRRRKGEREEKEHMDSLQKTRCVKSEKNNF